MTRKFKTMADAEPRHMVYSETTDAAHLGGVTLRGGDGFTAAETAQLMRIYGHAWFIYQMCERNLYRDGSRSDYWYRFLRDKAMVRITEIKAAMAEWEKSNRGPHA